MTVHEGFNRFIKKKKHKKPFCIQPKKISPKKFDSLLPLLNPSLNFKRPMVLEKSGPHDLNTLTISGVHSMLFLGGGSHKINSHKRLNNYLTIINQPFSSRRW